MFSYEFFEIFRNTFFIEHVGWLLLFLWRVSLNQLQWGKKLPTKQPEKAQAYLQRSTLGDCFYLESLYLATIHCCSFYTFNNSDQVDHNFSKKMPAEFM